MQESQMEPDSQAALLRNENEKLKDQFVMLKADISHLNSLIKQKVWPKVP